MSVTVSVTVLVGVTVSVTVSVTGSVTVSVTVSVTGSVTAVRLQHPEVTPLVPILVRVARLVVGVRVAPLPHELAAHEPQAVQIERRLRGPPVAHLRRSVLFGADRAADPFTLIVLEVAREAKVD